MWDLEEEKVVLEERLRSSVSLSHTLSHSDTHSPSLSIFPSPSLSHTHTRSLYLSLSLSLSLSACMPVKPVSGVGGWAGAGIGGGEDGARGEVESSRGELRPL